MRGTSRGAAAAGAAVLRSALAVSADTDRVAEDLFGACEVVDANATLRRALTDPSREAEAKSSLVEQLFSGKVSASATSVLAQLAAGRWSSERDLTDTIEAFAVDAALAGADHRGQLGLVEGELFRFERVVAASPELRDALTSRTAPASAKVAIVTDLLDGKVDAATLRLARQAVGWPRGRRFDATINEYLDVAAARRNQAIAVVTSAVPLSAPQQERLVAALQRLYGHSISLQTIVDPQSVGGVRVRVGDEVIDGTIARKLESARRHIGG